MVRFRFEEEFFSVYPINIFKNTVKVSQIQLEYLKPLRNLKHSDSIYKFILEIIASRIEA